VMNRRGTVDAHSSPVRQSRRSVDLSLYVCRMEKLDARRTSVSWQYEGCGCVYDIVIRGACRDEHANLSLHFGGGRAGDNPTRIRRVDQHGEANPGTALRT